jgi:hypothetical protein
MKKINRLLKKIFGIKRPAKVITVNVTVFHSEENLLNLLKSQLVSKNN